MHLENHLSNKSLKTGDNVIFFQGMTLCMCVSWAQTRNWTFSYLELLKRFLLKTSGFEMPLALPQALHAGDTNLLFMEHLPSNYGVDIVVDFE